MANASASVRSVCHSSVIANIISELYYQSIGFLSIRVNGASGARVLIEVSTSDMIANWFFTEQIMITRGARERR